MNLRKRKQQVINKFYGGEQKSWMHDFKLDDGVCKKCNKFIGEVDSMMCPVIGLDELRFGNIWGDD